MAQSPSLKLCELYRREGPSAPYSKNGFGTKYVCPSPQQGLSGHRSSSEAKGVDMAGQESLSRASGMRLALDHSWAV